MPLSYRPHQQHHANTMPPMTLTPCPYDAITGPHMCFGDHTMVDDLAVNRMGNARQWCRGTCFLVTVYHALSYRGGLAVNHMGTL